MKLRHYTFILGVILFLAATAYSQGAGIPNFPSTFNYSLPTMPPALSQNQIFLANCPYKLPIELRDVKVYGVSGTALAPDINMQIRIWTNNRKSACSYSKKLTLIPSASSNALVTNFQNALTQELINQHNANNQPNTIPNPISSTP